MAVKWEGFTEEDISKLQSPSVEENDSTIKFKGKRSAVIGDDKRRSALKKTTQSLRASTSPQDIPDISEKARLSKPKVNNQALGAQKEVNENTVENGLIISGAETSNQDSIQESGLKNDTSADVKSNSKQSLMAALITPTLSQSSPVPINLNDFGAKQKMMEEQNRLRKVLLAKALEDRKKQTHAEQRRLNMIQEELQKLDQRLSCDVSIIRNQIETASVEFMEAQKRYDRAEKEYLEAKLLLYTKLERKELLTHHLCAIIEQNEMRKAQKLSELMEKLNMPEPVSELESSIIKNSTECDEAKRKKSSSEIILSPASVEALPNGFETSAVNFGGGETSIIATPLTKSADVETKK